MMKVECTRLPSGLTVVTERMPHLESVALGVWIKSGSRNETVNEHGIAHLLEHMAFKGTRRRSAARSPRKIENVAARSTPQLRRKRLPTMHVYSRTICRWRSISLANILTESTFEADELRREKQVILQEIGAAATRRTTSSSIALPRPPIAARRSAGRPRHARKR